VSKPIRYEDRGASADKGEVHKAIAGEHPGLFPGAFCKILPDTLTGSPEHCLLIHADGAGTKSILAYLHWKETGDPRAFRGLAQDSLVMNVDDLGCVGVFGPFLLSNTIGRNAKLVPGEVIAEIIAGYRDCISMLASQGISVESGGGETADMGDTVRTVVIDSTVVARARRAEIISCERLRPGLAIVGLSSGGKATYETSENSGLGSNGYTMLRHEFLSPHYKEKYPEVYAPEIAGLAYTGPFRLSDPLPGSSVTVGEALLSPTRTYLPVLKAAVESAGKGIAAVFHNSGGGQTKCLRFGKGLLYVKDDLFAPQPVFRYLQENGPLPRRELYRTLNMGHRMEVVCDLAAADEVIAVSRSFGIEAKVVGRTEANSAPGAAQGANRLLVRDDKGEYEYTL
jgi:phosphoribosylformylglycinamidine cyclo-ligase